MSTGRAHELVWTAIDSGVKIRDSLRSKNAVGQFAWAAPVPGLHWQCISVWVLLPPTMNPLVGGSVVQPVHWLVSEKWGLEDEKNYRSASARMVEGEAFGQNVPGPGWVGLQIPVRVLQALAQVQPAAGLDADNVPARC